MASLRTCATSIHRSTSPPRLDLSGAAIQGNFEEKDPIILLPNQSDNISHLALDIGGSLIKLVYFSRHEDRLGDGKRKRSLAEILGTRRSYPILGGSLHFVKFETRKINECLDFIYSKQLHHGGIERRGLRSEAQVNDNAIMKATGGGAYKFANLFKERLGVSLDKEDEMDCLVAGANFLLKAIRHEAFTHMEGQKKFVQIDQNDLFPYLLVNIGSGVSLIKVDGDGRFQRVGGTSVGGGTCLGLGRFLTKCKSFDELLELSQRGDNRAIDMLVGDIYGGMDYSKIGLSVSTIASSFGKAVSENIELENCRPEDISLSILRMVSYTIAQIAYDNARQFALKRIFFGGSFIRGHAYTMDTMSFAVHFWSKGEFKAMFLRHEGFLGALGAFMSNEKHGLDESIPHQFVERYPNAAPYMGRQNRGLPPRDLSEKSSGSPRDLMGSLRGCATSIHRSTSRPQLDLSGAAIHGNFDDKDPTILLPNQSSHISHLALDIGGSLIKLVYFSRHEYRSCDDKGNRSLKEMCGVSNNNRSYPICGGRLHFVKFETRKINECLDFIYSKQLHRRGIDPQGWCSEDQMHDNTIIKATGGGAYKFADLFNEILDVSLDKEDEMECLVAGANFLLEAIRHEAFTHMKGQKQLVEIDQNDLYPYLLVNIGSGVSLIKVDGHGKFERVSGTSVGGGTYLGLGKFLTKCKSFDELLELSQRGDNRAIDMLVTDIYGGMDYSKIGFSASTIASSFGKAVSENLELEDCRPEDISVSLLRMVSNTIAQIAYDNARWLGLKRIFFGGFFIRGHAYTMDAISLAVQFWSKGEAKAMFLRHEGFLGALGAFMSYEL